MVSYSLIIKGRVQGVAFRWHTLIKALEFDLQGFVKNRIDESVEVVIEGAKKRADLLIDWCRIGPSFAEVEGVYIKEYEYQNFYKQFEIKG